MKKMALVFHAWDGYSWSWDLAMQCFKKFFDFSAMSSSWFFTEQLYPECRDLHFRHFGCGAGFEWTDRLRRGLEQVKEDYILYVMEDQWPFLKLSPDEWQDQIEQMGRLHANVLRLETSVSALYTCLPGNVEGVRQLDDDLSQYLLSCQPAIWRKDFLLSMLQESEGPHHWELEHSKKLLGKDNRIFVKPFPWCKHVIWRGQWIPEALQEMKERLANA